MARRALVLIVLSLCTKETLQMMTLHRGPKLPEGEQLKTNFGIVVFDRNELLAQGSFKKLHPGEVFDPQTGRSKGKVIVATVYRYQTRRSPKPEEVVEEVKMENQAHDKWPGCKNFVMPVLHVKLTEDEAIVVLPKGGESLEDMKNNGFFQTKRLFVELVMAIDMVMGVYCAHGAGIVHRDAKPDNFLVFGNHIMLIDFGEAACTDPTKCGTLGDKNIENVGFNIFYPRDETAKDQGGAVDIYSLGKTFQDLPILTQSELELGKLLQMMTGEWKDRPKIDKVLETLLRVYVFHWAKNSDIDIDVSEEQVKTAAERLKQQLLDGTAFPVFHPTEPVRDWGVTKTLKSIPKEGGLFSGLFCLGRDKCSLKSLVK